MYKSIFSVAAVAAVLTAAVIVVSGCSFPMNINRPIVNNTGATISRIYIRNTGTTDWGPELNRQARTRAVTYPVEMGVVENGVAYKKTEWVTRDANVTDDNGNIIYDFVNLANGESWPYSFIVPRVPSGESPQIKSIDVKVVDANGVVYGRNNVDLALVERIVITRNDMYPMLVMQNNTGFPISITRPITEYVTNGDYAVYGMTELINDRRNIVSYSIGNYRFDKEVMLDKPQTTIGLTDRPPTMTVQNNTGYPIAINNPFSEMIVNGAYSSQYLKDSKDANPKHIISYTCGQMVYNKEAMLNDEDVVVTLTDRPPRVTILNNTGNTVNIVFLRNSGSNWPDQNMLTIKLKEDGTLDDTQAATQAGERRGSFTNKETFRFWMGNVSGLKAGVYDIRIDDVQGTPYVKSNIQITEDMTLTFTQEDKP